MGKKAKAAARLKRLQKKRSEKAARKAMYESWKKAGTNSKSKRFMAQRKKNKRVNVVSHPTGENCGNLACAKCFPQYNEHKLEAA